MVKIDKGKRWELRQAKEGSITPQGRNLTETEGMTTGDQEGIITIRYTSLSIDKYLPSTRQ